MKIAPSHIRPEVAPERLSPAARAVYERMVEGTYEVDLDDLADALLPSFDDDPDPVSSASPLSPAAPVSSGGVCIPVSLSSAR